MKLKVKRILKTLLCVLLLLSLCGCWNRRELNTLAIVMGIGIDKAETANEIELTAQIANAGQIQSPSKKGGDHGKPFFNVETTGTDVFSILRDDTHKISRKLYIAQNQVIILGEDLSKEGVRDYFDFFLRDYEGRMNVYVLVAKGRARDILDVEPEFSTMPASHIAQLIEMQTATSESPTLRVIDLLKCLTSKSISAVAPIIQVQERGELKVVNITGSAVFKGDKVVGELSKKETRGMLWVTGDVKSGALCMNVDKGQAILEIIRASSKVTSEIKPDGTIHMKVKIIETGTLESQNGAENLAEFKNISILEVEAEDQIKQEIQNTLDKARSMGTDIYGFGEIIKQQHAKQWKNIEPKWDEQFKKLKVDIDVTAHITGAGAITKPAYPEGE